MPRDLTDETRDSNTPPVGIAHDQPGESEWAGQSHSGDANINTAITATRECRSVGD